MFHFAGKGKVVTPHNRKPNSFQLDQFDQEISERVAAYPGVGG